MFRIGYRTLKTGIATGIAILIAESLHLENYISAGIIAILCVQVTLKRSLKAATSRFLCSMLIMLLGLILFEGIGFKPYVVTILLLVYIPLTVRFKIQEGIVTSSVIMLHLYKSKHIDLDLLINEFWLVVIGIGAAFILNLFMPNLDMQLKTYQEKVDNQFKLLLHNIAESLLKEESFQERHIKETLKVVKEAKNLALRQLENNLLREEDYYYQYFRMREKQLDIIEHIVHILSFIHGKHEHVRWVAILIEDVSRIVRPHGSAKITLYELQEMKELFRSMPLPNTRDEFEVRAHLLQIIDELERYLLIKRNFSMERRKQMEN